MKIYLLFLYAIFVTSRANEVSRNRQLDANSELRLGNDLNRGAYLDGGDHGDRNIGRTVYVGRAGLGETVSVGKTNGLNDDSYVQRAGDSSQGYSVRNAFNPGQNAWRVGTNKGTDVSRSSAPSRGVSDDNLVGKATLARESSKVPFVWSRFPLVVRTGNLGQRANVLRTSDPGRAGGYGRENYISRVNGLSQVNNVARSNLGAIVPDVRARNHLTRRDNVGQGPNFGRTNHLDRSAPIVRAGSYGQETYVNNVDGLSQGDDDARSELNYDINRSDHHSTKSQVNRHGYSHPDPETERNQHNPSFGITTEGIVYEDRNNDRDSTGNLNNGFPSNSYGYPTDGYSVPNDGYGLNNDVDEIPNGYDAPDDVYGNPVDFDTPNNTFRISNKKYGVLDYNMLAPDFDNPGDSDINSITNNKITDSTIIAAYNDSNNNSNNNSSINDKNSITNRGGLFGDEYSVEHRGLHNTGIIFPDDVTIHNEKCAGANCQRITKTQSTTTTCEICKAKEITSLEPIVCDQCKVKEPPKCEHCVVKKPPKCEYCGVKKVTNEIKKVTNEFKKVTNEIKKFKNHCEHCEIKKTINNGDHYKTKQTNNCECKRSQCCGCNCCNSGCGCSNCGHSSGGCCSSKCSHGSSSCCGNSCGCNKQTYNSDSYENKEYSNNNNVDYNINYNSQGSGGGGGATGGAGGQFHTMDHSSEYDGAYGGAGGHINGHGQGSNQAGVGSSGETVTMYTDTSALDNTPNNLLTGIITSNTGSKGRTSSSASSNASAFSSSSAYAGGGHYNKIFSTYGNGGLYTNHLIGAHGGAIFGR